jgi:hypothetical protein
LSAGAACVVANVALGLAIQAATYVVANVALGQSALRSKPPWPVPPWPRALGFIKRRVCFLVLMGFYKFKYCTSLGGERCEYVAHAELP